MIKIVLTKTLALAILLSLLPKTAYADLPPRVVVSIKPVHSLVAGLMEGIATPELLVESGNPFEFSPSPDQQKALQQADLVVWVGPELTPGLDATLRKPDMAGRQLELLAMDSLKVLPARYEDGSRDPFLWLDTRNMLILLDELATRLSQLDPARTHRYRSNRLAVLARLSQIDRRLEFGYKNVSSEPVFLYHDTHQYFEQAYAMKAAGIVAPPDRPPATADLLRVRKLLADGQEPCLLIETVLPSPHAELLIQETNAQVIELDSLGSRLSPGPDLYVELMGLLYEKIQNCLTDRPAAMPNAGTRILTEVETAPEVYPHRIQGRYLLMNHFGETVSNLDFAGSYQLIYFGYTFCPDICPTSLATMNQALGLLGPMADRIQPLFITVDPERDTLDALRAYTAYFHPRLIGLTGPPEMIARTADVFHVRYEKVLTEGRDPDKYAVDHTSSLFLLGPDGEFVAKFAHGLPAADLADRLGEIIGD